MSHLRTAALFAIAFAGLTAIPAIAQDGPPPPPPPGAHGGGWQGNWQGQWQAPDNRVYSGTWSGTYERGGYPGGPQDGSMSQMDGPSPEGQAGGWGPPQDEHWQRMVERCSSNHRGGRIGGAVVGGVVGGVIGNRLADGNRALGTVLGAGAGAIGGAAVGGAIDRRHDRECDEFFRSAGPGAMPYPGGPGGPGGWAPPTGLGYGPGGYGPGGFGYGYVWVPVVIQGGGRGYTETVTTTEEFVGGGEGRRVIYRKPARIIHRAPRRVHDKRVYIGGS